MTRTEFKSLIKEAVAEAVRSEVAKVINAKLNPIIKELNESRKVRPKKQPVVEQVIPRRTKPNGTINRNKYASILESTEPFGRGETSLHFGAADAVSWDGGSPQSNGMMYENEPDIIIPTQATPALQAVSNALTRDYSDLVKLFPK